MSDRKHNFLVDTSFHICYFFEDQAQHQIARATVDYIKKTFRCYGFITTHLIFFETMATVLHGRNIKTAIKDKKIRKQYADALCQDIIKHCEVRAIPEDMFLDIWNLYQSEGGKRAGLEYVDCSSMVFARDIKKYKYKEDHRIIFDGVLSFNPRHFNEEWGKEFGFKVFDYSILPIAPE